MLSLALVFVLLSQSADALPGDSYARPAPGLVLRSGPSAHHPGVLVPGEDAALRVGPGEGDFVKVYVPQGFPVYVHADYVSVDRAEQRVTIGGDRVNVRLLPSTVGLLPVGQLDAADGPLLLLDEEGAWVRVLAPLGLPLHAPREELVPEASAALASRWAALRAGRETRRQERVAAFRATDPTWRRSAALDDEVASVAAADLGALTDEALVARRAQLADLLERVDREPTRQRLAGLQRELEIEVQKRQATARTREELARQEAREAADLVREARVLDLGLRFEGKGESLRVEGLVTRRSSAEQDVSVYSVKDAEGRSFKLSAAPEVARLAPLLGKRVVLEGRSLPLVNVQGSVLIVDRVARVQP